ncbi:AraC family transcriptional regulator [Chitinophaga pendula]|uniref:helix-turn-helix domain-containing protein n=1 Tax=Chitinophaga TaxID=79328 RepID=UPI0012FD2706|nr:MULTISPECIES: AraC family transcriptional regulator [Chitinophaga]UCJ09978.1 AraC family transcriptional regulator [Chitinophaga pendula]
MSEVAPAIFFSCTQEQYVSNEHLIKEHTLCYVYEGEMNVSEHQSRTVVHRGDLAFLAKNRLLRVTKNASTDRPVKSVVVFFPQDFLQQYYSRHAPVLEVPWSLETAILPPHVLWENYFRSLQPYMDPQQVLPADLVSLKRTEALSIFRTLHPGIDRVLSNFAVPGKIDLAGFIQHHYTFNLSLSQLAYLTGRSLSTFKRDFQKIFLTTPQRWLTGKRLEFAYHLIRDKQLKPSDVYLESGFENFSHFSRAFKSQYGFPPSQLKQ